MVKLRLTRTGKRNQPSYRLVAIQARTKRDGEAIEYLGHYNPISKVFKCEKERVEYWLEVGAQPSDTVRSLLVKEKILKAPKTKKKYSKEPGEKAKARKAEKEKKSKDAKQKAKEKKEEKKEEPKEKSEEKPDKEE
jgi:small subunit ribosomal protein S16